MDGDKHGRSGNWDGALEIWDWGMLDAFTIGPACCVSMPVPVPCHVPRKYGDSRSEGIGLYKGVECLD